MSVYGVATDQWDPIVVYICLQNLPKLTLTLWEQSIKNKSSLSSWIELDAFLTERIQTLTCLEHILPTKNKLLLPKKMYSQTSSKKLSRNIATHHSSNKLLSAHHAKCVTAPRAKNSPSKTSCSICPNQSHHLRLCPQFPKLSFEDKFSIVKKNKCCVNCLSRGHVVKT